MPRAARALANNEVYHVLNRGNGRATVFHKAEDFEAFVRLRRKGGQIFIVDKKRLEM